MYEINKVKEEENVLQLLFHKWELADVKYCVLRNYDTLPKSTNKSDLDIFVSENDNEKFNLVISKFLLEKNLHLVSKIDNKEYKKLCLLGRANDKWWGIQIDVFNAIKYKNNEIISEKLIWENVKRYNGINVLDKNIGGLLSFLKEILNNGKCDQKYFDTMALNYLNAKTELQNCLKGYSKSFKIELERILIESFNLEEVKKLSQYAKETFPDNLTCKIKRLFYKSKRILSKPGYSIVFLGADGAGKSTIINEIIPILNDSFHNSVKYEHLRPNMLPPLAQLFGSPKVQNMPVVDPHAKKPSNIIGSLIRFLYYFMDYTIGYSIKVFPQIMFRANVWIFDRYYYDFIVDPLRARIKLPSKVIKAFQHLIPEPDVIICLGTDPIIIHDRKPELQLEEVSRQVTVLKKFCKNNKRAVWVDTGESVEKSFNDAMEAIVHVMARNFDKVAI